MKKIVIKGLSTLLDTPIIYNKFDISIIMEDEDLLNEVISNSKLDDYIFARSGSNNIVGGGGVHFASSLGNKKMLEILLDKYAVVNILDDQGNSPIDYALKRPIIVEILLNAGADIKVKKTNGKSVVCKAKELDLVDTLKTFNKHGYFCS